jgi:hypothetical protein
MSNSRKKTPIHGITICESEKQDKRLANRQFRRVVKQKVKLQEEIFPEKRELSNVWSFGKDGKVYYNKLNDKVFRK